MEGTLTSGVAHIFTSYAHTPWARSLVRICYTPQICSSCNVEVALPSTLSLPNEVPVGIQYIQYPTQNTLPAQDESERASARMRFASVVAAAGLAQAHTIFVSLEVGGVNNGVSNGVRTPSYDGPITDVSSNSIACNGDPNPTMSTDKIIDVRPPRRQAFTRDNAAPRNTRDLLRAHG